MEVCAGGGNAAGGLLQASGHLKRRAGRLEAGTTSYARRIEKASAFIKTKQNKK